MPGSGIIKNKEDDPGSKRGYYEQSNDRTGIVGVL
jgi:hypothetical protein